MNTHTPRLWVFDGDAVVAQVLANAARDLGFDAIATHEVERFLAACDGGIDLAVVDPRVPGFDGTGLLHRLAHTAVPPALVLTSALDEAVLAAARELAQALGLRVCGTLQKPFGAAPFAMMLGAARRAGYARSEPSPATDEHATLDGDLRFAPRRLLGTDEIVGFHAGVSPSPHATDRDVARAIEATVAMLARGRRLRPAIRASVDVPTVSASLVDATLEALARHGVHEDALALVLREGASCPHEPAGLAACLRLRMAGVGIAVDGFGTGFASLLGARRIAVDELRIDRSFVEALPEHRRAASVVRNLVLLGHDLGARVVACGVASERVASALVALGASTGEGPHCGAPVGAAALERMLAARLFEAPTPVAVPA